MLSKIIIKNFKGIIDTTIHCEKDYNVLIGENNIGKTTIFEAIHLWKMCYDLNILKSNKGFYSVAKNILFRNMEFMRVSHARDLFPRDKSSSLVCNITLTFTLDEADFNLGFKLVRPTHIEDAYLQVKYVDANEFQRFATKINANPKYNVANAISINESRPVANIIANEPKMTIGEVRDKLSKGKGYEVLRNKVQTNGEKVAGHIFEITGRLPVFSFSDKGAYLEMKVDGRDILSCGSGFIQLVELFSSIEYTNALIKILLIDEPDAHIHVKMQRKLVERLQSLPDYQLFVISHNVRFVNETQDSKLFYVDGLANVGNTIKHIDSNIRPLLVEGLTGIVNELDEWRTAQKILLVEGTTDVKFLQQLLQKYANVSSVSLPNLKLYQLNGIDALYAKLDVLTRSMDDIIPGKKWLLIRDTDCFPPSKIKEQKNKFINAFVKRDVKFDIYYQDGYGIESTFMTDVSHAARLLHKRYIEIPVDKIKSRISSLNSMYEVYVKDTLNKVHLELRDKHFVRQKELRKSLYQGIKFDDVLKEITPDSIKYIMTKTIANWYYNDLHNELKKINPDVVCDPITNDDIMKLYLDNIDSADDMFQCHVEMINRILE